MVHRVALCALALLLHSVNGANDRLLVYKSDVSKPVPAILVGKTPIRLSAGGSIIIADATTSSFLVLRDGSPSALLADSLSGEIPLPFPVAKWVRGFSSSFGVGAIGLDVHSNLIVFATSTAITGPFVPFVHPLKAEHPVAGAVLPATCVALGSCGCDDYTALRECSMNGTSMIAPTAHLGSVPGGPPAPTTPSVIVDCGACRYAFAPAAVPPPQLPQRNRDSVAYACDPSAPVCLEVSADCRAPNPSPSCAYVTAVAISAAAAGVAREDAATSPTGSPRIPLPIAALHADAAALASSATGTTASVLFIPSLAPGAADPPTAPSTHPSTAVITAAWVSDVMHRDRAAPTAGRIAVVRLQVWSVDHRPDAPSHIGLAHPQPAAAGPAAASVSEMGALVAHVALPPLPADATPTDPSRPRVAITTTLAPSGLRVTVRVAAAPEAHHGEALAQPSQTAATRPSQGSVILSVSGGARWWAVEETHRLPNGHDSVTIAASAVPSRATSQIGDVLGATVTAIGASADHTVGHVTLYTRSHLPQGTDWPFASVDPTVRLVQPHHAHVDVDDASATYLAAPSASSLPGASVAYPPLPRLSCRYIHSAIGGGADGAFAADVPVGHTPPCGGRAVPVPFQVCTAGHALASGADGTAPPPLAYHCTADLVTAAHDLRSTVLLAAAQRLAHAVIPCTDSVSDCAAGAAELGAVCSACGALPDAAVRRVAASGRAGLAPHSHAAGAAFTQRDEAAPMFGVDALRLLLETPASAFSAVATANSSATAAAAAPRVRVVVCPRGPLAAACLASLVAAGVALPSSLCADPANALGLADSAAAWSPSDDAADALLRRVSARAAAVAAAAPAEATERRPVAEYRGPGAGTAARGSSHAPVVRPCSVYAKWAARRVQAGDDVHARARAAAATAKNYAVPPTPPLEVTPSPIVPCATERPLNTSYRYMMECGDHADAMITYDSRQPPQSPTGRVIHSRFRWRYVPTGVPTRAQWECPPTETASLTPTPSAPSHTSTGTATPTATETATHSDTHTDVPSITPSVTASETPSPTSTVSLTPSNSPTASNTPTATRTGSHSLSQTNSPTATVTLTPSPTHSKTPTRSLTNTATSATLSGSGTETRTPTDTATLTPSGSSTPSHSRSTSRSSTFTATATATLTRTSSGSATHSRTVTSSESDTATRSATMNPTSSATATVTSTLSRTPSETATATPTPTHTATLTSTPSSTVSDSPSSSPTPPLTHTATVTASPSVSSTPTESPTSSPAPTATVTATSSASHTATGTPPVTLSRTRSRTETETSTPTLSSMTASSTLSTTPTASGSRTATTSDTWTGSASDSGSPTRTTTHSNSRSPTRSTTPTRSHTGTGSATGSETQTKTPTHSSSRSLSRTRSPTHIQTPTVSVTRTLTRTRTTTQSDSLTPTDSVSRTRSQSDSETRTTSRSHTDTRTSSRSATLSYSPSETATTTRSPSHSETNTRTPSDSHSATRSDTTTRAPSVSRTPTATESATTTPFETVTATATRTRTKELTRSPSRTATSSPTPAQCDLAYQQDGYVTQNCGGPTASGTLCSAQCAGQQQVVAAYDPLSNSMVPLTQRVGYCGTALSSVTCVEGVYTVPAMVGCTACRCEYDYSRVDMRIPCAKAGSIHGTRCEDAECRGDNFVGYCGAPAGAGYVECVNGEWIDSYGDDICEPCSCPTAVTQGAALAISGPGCEAGSPHGSTCDPITATISCGAEYEGVPTGSVGCYYGRWYGVFDGCLPRQCLAASFPRQAGGCPDSSHGASCPILCATDPSPIATADCLYGTWVGPGTLGCPPERCTTDPPVGGSFIVSCADSHDGARCHVASCASGLTGTPTGYTTCTDGVWGALVATGCTPKACTGPPEVPSYVFASCASYAAGATCVATCEAPYYETSGPTTIGSLTCTGAGWEGSLVRCVPKGCPAAPTASAGYQFATCISPAQHGASCFPMCAPGYCGSPTGNAQCRFGAWQVVAAGCSPCRCDAPLRSEGYITTNCPQGATSGTTCVVTCDAPLFTGTSSVATCTLGTWSALPGCARASCVPYTQPGYTTSCAGGPHGTLCTPLGCSGGLLPSPTIGGQVYCDSGRWVGGPFYGCRPASCPLTASLPLISMRYQNCAPGVDHAHGTVCRPECAGGYCWTGAGSSPPESVCNGGTWDPPLPPAGDCQPCRCHHALQPIGAAKCVIPPGGVPDGDDCTPTCLPGHIGPYAYPKCERGEWPPAYSACSPSCTPIPSDELYDYSSCYSYMTTCVPTCTTGRGHPRGNLRCHFGEFIGVPYTGCESKQCHFPPVVPGYRIVECPFNASEGTTCRAVCDKGYCGLATGTIQCFDGQYEPAADAFAGCAPCPCTDALPPPPADYEYTEDCVPGMAHGTSCSFRCRKHTPTGSLCHSGTIQGGIWCDHGKWVASPVPPSGCTMCSCPHYTSQTGMYSSSVHSPGDYPPGVYSATCKSPFTLISGGTPQIMCLGGRWIGAFEGCVKSCDGTSTDISDDYSLVGTDVVCTRNPAVFVPTTLVCDVMATKWTSSGPLTGCGRPFCPSIITDTTPNVQVVRSCLVDGVVPDGAVCNLECVNKNMCPPPTAITASCDVSRPDPLHISAWADNVCNQECGCTNAFVSDVLVVDASDAFNCGRGATTCVTSTLTCKNELDGNGSPIGYCGAPIAAPTASCVDNAWVISGPPPTQPSCAGCPCAEPFPISPAAAEPYVISTECASANAPSGTICTATCALGYVGSPDFSATCVLGQWTGAPPKGCQPRKCLDPVTPLLPPGYKAELCGAGTPHGTKCVISCDTGYCGVPSTVGGPAVQCLLGDWDIPPALAGCTRCECSRPFRPPTGYVALAGCATNAPHGTECVLGCAATHTGTAVGHVECNSGVWSAATPYTGCAPKMCAALTMPDGYTVSNAACLGASVPDGTVCVAQCAETLAPPTRTGSTGWCGTGSGLRECVHGVWRGAAFSGCAPCPCMEQPVSRPLWNTIRVSRCKPGDPHGTQCEVSCADGYHVPSGQSLPAIDCSHGAWTSFTSPCQPKPCPEETYSQLGYVLTPAGPLAHGNKYTIACDAAGGFVGSVATPDPQCAFGRILLGTPSALVGCRKKTCTTAYAPANAAAYDLNEAACKAGASHGRLCLPICAPGYFGLVASTATCIDGAWTGALSGCEPSPCWTSYLQPGYAITGCVGGAAHGHTCTAVCQSKTHEGTAVGTVQCALGAWSGTFSGCQARKCSSYSQTGYVVSSACGSAPVANGTTCVAGAVCAPGYLGTVESASTYYPNGIPSCFYGEWAGGPLRGCTAASCTGSYSQQGYTVTDACLSGAPEGAICGALCAPGYVGGPASTVTCSGGAYVGSFTGCVPSPCTAAYSQDGYAVTGCGAGAIDGTICSATCARGYCGSATISLDVTCAGGVWTGSFVGCTPCPCMEYVLDSLIVTGCSSVNPGDACAPPEVECDVAAGWGSFVGAPGPTCASSGSTWGAESDGCSSIACGPMVTPSYAALLYEPTSIAVGDTVGMQCLFEDGYCGSGDPSAVATCTSTGWTTAATPSLSCYPCTCPARILPLAGSRVQEGYVPILSCATGGRYYHDAECGVECDEGFQGSATGVARCRFGAWSVTSALAGCTPIPCPGPYVQGGYVVTGCVASSPTGSSCTAECAPGFEGTVQGSVVCNKGNWVGAFEGCDPSSCRAPLVLNERELVASTTCGANTPHGAPCIQSCRHGPSSSSGMRCWYGNYVGHSAGCSSASCYNAFVPPVGYYLNGCTAGSPHGHRCFATCRRSDTSPYRGYCGEATGHVTCMNGVWVGPALAGCAPCPCRDVHPSARLAVVQASNCGGGVANGGICRLRPNAGALDAVPGVCLPSPSEVAATCEEGAWNTATVATPFCGCALFSAVGYVVACNPSGSLLPHGSDCEATGCATGWSGSPSGRLRCVAGKLTGPGFIGCVPNVCGSVPSIPLGYTVSGCPNNSPHKTKCPLMCDFGYCQTDSFTTTSSYVECIHGAWIITTPSTATCQPCTCRVRPSDGRTAFTPASCPGVFPNAMCKGASCIGPFGEAVSPSSLSYRCEDGGWVRKTSVEACQYLPCNALSTPVSLTSTNCGGSGAVPYGTRCAVQCAASFCGKTIGYQACGPRGLWVQPLYGFEDCAGCRCGDPAPADPGIRSADCNGTQSGSSCTLMCMPGHTMGYTYPLCQGGSWSGALPTCTPLSCTAPPDDNLGGLYTHTCTITPSGSTCTATCAAGSSPRPGAVLTLGCHQGKWDSVFSGCVPDGCAYTPPAGYGSTCGVSAIPSGAVCHGGRCTAAGECGVPDVGFASDATFDTCSFGILTSGISGCSTCTRCSTSHANVASYTCPPGSDVAHGVVCSPRCTSEHYVPTSASALCYDGHWQTVPFTCL